VRFFPSFSLPFLAIPNEADQPLTFSNTANALPKKNEIISNLQVISLVRVACSLSPFSSLIADGRPRQHLLRRRVFYNAKAPPSRIAFFRDGVSEAEFGNVKEKGSSFLPFLLILFSASNSLPPSTEVEALRAACAQLPTDPTTLAFLRSVSDLDDGERSKRLAALKAWKPQITFLAVVKRHHLRFFQDVGGDGRNIQNIAPNTIVDESVTDPRAADWYGAAHLVRPLSLFLLLQLS
jgi:hypothetical protein